MRATRFAFEQKYSVADSGPGDCCSPCLHLQSHPAARHLLVSSPQARDRQWFPKVQ